MIIYVMLCIATGIFGHDLMVVLIRTIAAPFWYATEENEWKHDFFSYMIFSYHRNLGMFQKS